jgi:hypothetical protein
MCVVARVLLFIRTFNKIRKVVLGEIGRNAMITE